jgi:cbb3-type cytochrome oxidase maturation protein
MGIVPILAIAALSMSVIGVGFFVWAVSAGQFEELEAESVRALLDGAPIGEDEP